MSVKVAERVGKSRWEKAKSTELKGFVIRHTLTFIAGILFSLAGFNNEFSPFGVAFCGSVPKDLTITAALGATVGWFFSLDSVSALRYTSAVLALCVIMSALKPFRQIRDNAVTPLITVFICLFVTGLAIVFAEEATLLSVMLSFAEGAIGSATAYLLFKSQTVLSLKGGLTMLTSKEATAVIISAMLLLLSIRKVELFGVHPANIITTLLILVCAFYCKEAGGAIVGICGGLTSALGNSHILLLSFYSFGGLLAGVFSAYGRIATFLAFVFSGVAVTVISYENESLPIVLIETAAAGISFFVLSNAFDEKIRAILKPNVTSPILDTVKNDVFNKLKYASKASAEICASLSSVSDALSKSEKSDIGSVSKKTKERVCGSCGLYDTCWQENRDATQDAFNTLLTMKKEGKYLEYKTVPQQFAAKCIRTENVSSSFNKLYGEYKTRERLEGRFNEMHKSASEQFINVSALLDSLCSKIDEEIRFDMDCANRVKAATVTCGFEGVECCSYINSMEKMTIALKVKSTSGKLNLSSLSTQIGIITGRSFELPLIEREDEITKITYREKYEYKIINSGVQFCANGERYSGDTFSTFEDGNGMFYAVICDGMGTGTRAALSSGLAVTLLEKLIKAGFGIKASINTVNTSLISKSGEECSVTLDLTAIDLFTGHVEFYKCGASNTVVRKNGKILDVGFSSLPLGILSNTEISCGSGNLGYGDVLVMSSDGVREEDMPFLKKELKKFSEGNVRGFTTELCESIRRLQPEKQDDLTVLTLAVTRNE
ncbi:MAG: SpoIIE family protein phosphatase [Clostridia bacterium]|nr:SpoIIE family protein phosphatase [Clostridia bacterium]